MRSFVLKIVSCIILCGCAGAGVLNPSQQGAVTGTVTGLLVKDAMDMIPKFQPYLKIEDFEVCVFKKGTHIYYYDCILVASGKKRVMNLSESYKIDENVVVITESSFIRLMANIEVFCSQFQSKCKAVVEDYNSISKMFIVGDPDDKPAL